MEDTVWEIDNVSFYSKRLFSKTKRRMGKIRNDKARIDFDSAHIHLIFYELITNYNFHF